MSDDDQQSQDIVYVIKNMSWPTDNLFNKNDSGLVMNEVNISELEANLLTTTGMTKEQADERGGGMWVKVNSSLSTTGKDEISNYFNKLYSKLSCCTGASEVTIPLLEKEMMESSQMITKLSN